MIDSKKKILLDRLGLDSINTEVGGTLPPFLTNQKGGVKALAERHWTKVSSHNNKQNWVSMWREECGAPVTRSYS